MTSKSGCSNQYSREERDAGPTMLIHGRKEERQWIVWNGMVVQRHMFTAQDELNYIANPVNWK